MAAITRLNIGGHEVIIDAEDIEKVSKLSWYPNYNRRGVVYFRANLPGGGSVYLHRYLLDYAGPLQVDHKESRLDHRKENLRLCCQSQNNGNLRKRKNTASQYKGVTRNEGRWRAKIKYNGFEEHLGYFHTEQAAAQAYDIAAKRVFGKFARLNFE